MKKIFLSVSIITIFFFQSKAQYNYENLLALKNQTIQVVLNDDDDTSHYNPAIKSAMDTYWTFSKYKFITLAEYEKVKKEKTYTFLLPFRTIFNCCVDELSIIEGGDLKYGTLRYNSFYLYYQSPAYIGKMPFLSDKYYHSIKGEPHYYIAKKKDLNELLPNIIQQWQWENETILKHSELKKESDAISFLADETDLKQLKEKTLFIDSISFAGITNSAVATYYKYKFKIVSLKDIFKAIEDQDESICYLYSGSRAHNCSYPISIYEAKGGKGIYEPGDNHIITFSGTAKPKFIEDYFTALMTAIDK